MLAILNSFTFGGLRRRTPQGKRAIERGPALKATAS